MCNIETNGRHLPKVLNIKFNRGEESPAAFYERIKSSFIDSLMPIGTMFHGVPLINQETLSPTFESVIVIMCLKAIHSELPEFIMQNKGMLFTNATPNFCDIQGELWDTMDTLLSQMEAQDNIHRLQAIDQPENLRWIQSKTTNRNSQASKSNPVSKRLNRTTCDYCAALGKDERIWSSHDKLNCFSLFPEKRKNKPLARMLSVPIYTDDDNSWDLQQALTAVEDQFYASKVSDSVDDAYLSENTLTPQ